MRRLAPLTVLGALAAALAPAAHAVDYTVDLSYPNADQSVLHAAAGAGFAACGGGAGGNLCRTPGVVTAAAAPNLAIPAWNAADFIFTPPAGTTIAGGAVTMAWRNSEAACRSYSSPSAFDLPVASSATSSRSRRSSRWRTTPDMKTNEWSGFVTANCTLSSREDQRHPPRGRSLAFSKAAFPILEAVINSIRSIQEARDAGRLPRLGVSRSR